MLQQNVYSSTGKEECGGFSDTGRGDLLGKKTTQMSLSFVSMCVRMDDHIHESCCLRA